MNGDSTVTTQCRESGGHFQLCLNPLCNNPVEPKRKHAPVKHYCCAECTQEASILKRAAALLLPSGKEKAWQALTESQR